MRLITTLVVAGILGAISPLTGCNKEDAQGNSGSKSPGANAATPSHGVAFTNAPARTGQAKPTPRPTTVLTGKWKTGSIEWFFGADGTLTVVSGQMKSSYKYEVGLGTASPGEETLIMHPERGEAHALRLKKLNDDTVVLSSPFGDETHTLVRVRGN